MLVSRSVCVTFAMRPALLVLPLDAAAQVVRLTFPVATTRVYATGLSRGWLFVHRLAAELLHRIATPRSKRRSLCRCEMHSGHADRNGRSGSCRSTGRPTKS